MEGWKYWMGKKVFIVLKSKRQYTGKVLEVEDGDILSWMTILDKFNNRIGFNTSEIDLIQEERE